MSYRILSHVNVVKIEISKWFLYCRSIRTRDVHVANLITNLHSLFKGGNPLLAPVDDDDLLAEEDDEEEVDKVKIY